MTHQQKIDSQLILNQLYDKHGYELIEMLGLKILIEANNHDLQGNTIVSYALKTAGRRLQAEYASLVTSQLINELMSS